MIEMEDSPAKTKGHVKGQLLKRSVIGSIWMMSSAFSIRFVKLFVFAILARLLTPEDFGVFAGAMVIFSLTGVFVGFGLGAALIQRKEILAEHVSMAIYFTAGMGIIVTGLIYIYSGLLADLIGLPRVKTVLQLFCPLCLVQSLAVVPTSLVGREMDFALAAKIQFVAFFIGYGVVALPVGYLGAGYWALVIGLAVQYSLSALLFTICQKFSYQAKFSLRAIGDLLKVGSGYALGQTSTALGRNGDYFITGRFLGDAALGIYSRAYGIMETAVGVFITATKQVFLPIFSSAQDNNERLRDAMRVNLSVVFGIYVIISIIAIVVAEELIQILLGPQWGAVVLPFQILCLGMCFRAGWKISTTILVAKGLSYRASACQVTYAVLVLIGAFFGSQFGLPGVAYGVLAALFVTFAMSQILASIQIDFPFSNYGTALVRMTILLVIAGGPAWCAAQTVRSFSTYSIVIVVIATAFGIFGPLLLMALCPRFMVDPYSLKRLDKIIKQFGTRASPRISGYLSMLPVFAVLRHDEIGNETLHL